MWLPHVGGRQEQLEALGVVAWLVGRLLAGGALEEERAALGVTPSAWKALLAGVVRVRDAHEAPAEVLAARVGWSTLEVEQVRWVLQRHPREAGELDVPAGAILPGAPAAREGMHHELTDRYGFSALAAELYLEWLAELVTRLQVAPAAEGEVVVLAIDATEGARAKLDQAELVPVRLSFFSDGYSGRCRHLIPIHVAI
ncbi:MAG: hypothetical protein U5K81_06910 [Trueperaceae bacterium]|nr:hypothetical protein [Trueperaceae bacterium]